MEYPSGGREKKRTGGESYRDEFTWSSSHATPLCIQPPPSIFDGPQAGAAVYHHHAKGIDFFVFLPFVPFPLGVYMESRNF